jgi:hypothetical protein
VHEIKALTSFSGIISMCVGEMRNVDDDAIVADLLRAGYVEEIGKPAEVVEAEEPASVEEVKPKRGRTKKTATETEE